MISIHMLKICGKTIIKHILIIYKKCLAFPISGRKQILFLSIKSDKQLLKNYRPISQLPICGKVLERLHYNSMFEFFLQNNLITPRQSAFRAGVSCINHLISITHEVYKSFDDGYEVRGVFLDISKAFDKVCHQGLHYKLRQNGISGKLLNTLTDFLDNRIQRGHIKRSIFIIGSILGSLLFLIYINDLSENLPSNPKLFAENTSRFSVVKNIDA